MLTVTCQQCDQKTQLIKGLVACPHCNADLKKEIEEVKEMAAQRTIDVNQNIDPMVTLVVGMPATGPEKTLGRSDFTIRNQDEGNEDAPPADARATLIVENPTPLPTVINPQAAAEAAENYSLGLNTVIPPRNISKDESRGRIQDYVVEERLGSGAFGVVFRATQVPLERNVAVKVLQDSAEISDAARLKQKNDFLREAQFTGRLEHPNIVPIHDIGLTVSEEGRANPFYVMKEIRGVSWLEKIRKQSRAENLKIFKNVINAVAFAHAQGIVHCDLKPDNVMVGEFGEVLVVDWGQAIDLGDEATIRPGGTPAYISPEMAQYWIDIHLEHKPKSPCREQVGVRSDVYLLGSLLYEVVTGGPPHHNKELTPYEIMHRAALNEVPVPDKHENDELMQIALAAMRLGPREKIETIEGLSTAIRIYEDRLSSNELRQRAYKILANAKSNSDYDEFQRARFGFEESLEKWEGNSRSKQGLRDAQLSCAELALKDQNFDLGIQMIENPQTDEEKDLKSRLVEGKAKRDRQKKLVRYLALGLAGSIIVGIALNGLMIRENYNSLKLRDVAVSQKVEAEEATFKANEERNKALEDVLPLRNEIAQKQLEIEQFPDRLEEAKSKFEDDYKLEKGKLEQLLVAEKAQSKKDLEREIENRAALLQQEQQKHDRKLADEKAEFAVRLDKEKKRFETETETLVQKEKQLKRQVSDLNESSKLLRYKGSLTNVIQKLQSGNFRETRQLIDELPDKNAWEVQRLNLLAHREIEAIFPDKPMVSFASSADGSRFAQVFDDRVEIRDTEQFNKVLVSVVAESASAVAVSANGDLIAIGKPADSALEPGKIWIVDLSNPQTPRQLKTLAAQSSMISGLEFSFDSSRLLAVGKPSKIRKSTGTGSEKELMVWDNNWSPIQVDLIAVGGELPKFSKATFSENGKRILVTNPDSLPREQAVHLFEQNGEGYRWLITAPETGINVATFCNSSGTQVVACSRDNKLGSYSLATWNIDGPDDQPNQFVSTATPTSKFKNVAQLSQKALSIKKYNNLLVTSGQDRKATIWDWQTMTPTSFGGHARDVNHSILIPAEDFNDNVLISVATGPNPEILKTDLSTYENEVDSMTIGRIPQNEQPSPSAMSHSVSSNRFAFGNNRGQASVVANGQTIQWEITAWKQHILSDDFLVAQSQGDYIYVFDRKTGALNRVLINLATTFENEVAKMEVSDDGKIALIIINDREKQFHIWDLEKDELIRTVDYGKGDVFGTGTEKALLSMTLSPDGRWVIGGKVGVFAWSTETGVRKRLTQASPEMARNPISSIQFVDQGLRFLVSWKDRIDLFNLANPASTRRFNTDGISYNKSESNVYDARITGNQVLVLARSISKPNQSTGVVLLDLVSKRRLAQFNDARYASFARSNKNATGDVIVVNKPVKNLETQPPILQKWVASTRKTETIQIEPLLTEHFDSQFRAIEKAYQLNGQITLQESVRSRNNSLRRDWSTISVENNLEMGPLRIIAKPKVDFHATTGDRAITLEHGSIRFWKLFPTSVQPDGVLPGFYRTCKLSPDEKTLVAIQHDSQRVIMLDPETGKTKQTINSTAESNCVSVGWNPNSNQIAIGTESGQVETWSLNDDKQPTGKIKVTDSPVTEVAIAKDGSILAIASEKGMAFVLRGQADDWEQISLGHVDGQQILTGDISADGKRVITGSASGRLTVWNAELLTSPEIKFKSQKRSVERELHNLQNKHQSAISIAKFVTNSKGATEVFSADSDSGENQILIWKTEPLK